ncbi:TPA: hypothetical protein ACGSUT_000793 [Vibrio parahaemolyticus]
MFTYFIIIILRSVFSAVFLLLFVNVLEMPLVAPTLPSAALKVPFLAPKVLKAPERSEISAKHAVVL